MRETYSTMWCFWRLAVGRVEVPGAPEAPPARRDSIRTISLLAFCLLLTGCVPPSARGAAVDDVDTHAVVTTREHSELGHSAVQPADVECSIVCGATCCTADEVCTANRCAPLSECQRELGPTSTRIDNVAFSRIATTVRKAAPGTLIVLAPGTYTEPLVVRGTGAPNAPVILAADPPGSVKFSGAGRLEIAGDYFTISGFDFDEGVIPVGLVAVLFRNCRHCRLTNSKIRRYLPVEGNYIHWVRFTTGHHNRIDHCEVHDKSDFREMIRVTNFTEGFDRIDHNYLHDFIKTPPTNGGEGIRLGTGGAAKLQTTVDNNLFERIRSEQEIISVKSSANTLSKNTFRECFSELTIRGGNDNVVTGNVFIASLQYPGSGVRAYGNGNRIEDNNFKDLVTGIRLGAGSADGSCYAAANDAIIRRNRFTNISQQEIMIDFMLGWNHFKNCPPTDVVATGQVIDNPGGPADISRAYVASDPCLGPNW